MSLLAAVKLITSFIDLPWSIYTVQAHLGAGAGDVALPSLTVAGIPAGAALLKAFMFVKFSGKENVNAAVNFLSGAQNIQAKKTVGGAWVTGIAFSGGEYSTPGTTREGGDVFMPTADIVAQIPENGQQIDFKWTQAKSDSNFLNFNDLQVAVRIFYTLP